MKDDHHERWHYPAATFKQHGIRQPRAAQSMQCIRPNQSTQCCQGGCAGLNAPMVRRPSGSTCRAMSIASLFTMSWLAGDTARMRQEGACAQEERSGS